MLSTNLKRFIAAFWPFIRPYRYTLALAYLGTGAVALCILSIGLFINAELDDALKDIEHLQALTRFTLPILLILATGIIVQSIASYTISWAGVRYIRALRVEIFRKTLVQRHGLIDDESSGELQTRVVADTSQLGNFIGGTIPGLLSTLLFLVGGLGGAFFVSPRLTLMTIGVAIAFAIPILVFSPILRRFGERLQKAEAQVGRHAGETFRMYDVVNVFQQVAREVKRFFTLSGEVVHFYLAQERLQISIFAVLRIAIFSLLIMGGSYGIYLVTSEQMTIGSLVSFAYFASMIVTNVTGVAGIVTSFNVAFGRAQKLIEIVEMDDPDLDTGSLTRPATCDIEIKNLDFTYPTRDTPALSNIDLKIPFKSKVAVVGPSGSGKSTLFKLLLGILDPTSGEIRINGNPPRLYAEGIWRGCFGYVPQENALLSGTVEENIAYGNPEASTEEIEEAARLAYADEFIRDLPEGYKTDLGEVGDRLSGGQRQRICLARAILIKPKVFLFDEATSSLDVNSEQAVERAIKELSETSTIISIAHRLNTIENADIVLVLDEGKLIYEGHHELLIENEIYSNMVVGYRK